MMKLSLREIRLKPIKCLFNKHKWATFQKYDLTWRQCLGCPKLQVFVEPKGIERWVDADKVVETVVEEMRRIMNEIKKVIENTLNSYKH